jgi:type IV pilus assembly protein PilW
MKRDFYPDGCQQGFTLVEIMVAMLLGLFLLGGGLQVVTHSKTTYRTQEALSRIQENGRFALYFLAQDIRMAGFIGCGNQDALTNTLNTPTAFLYNFGTAIEGFESSSATAWTPSINNLAIPSPLPSALPGSDIITVRRVDDQGFTVTAHAAATSGLTLDATATTANLKSAGFLTSTATNNCAIAVVTDCSSAAVFQVSGVAASVLSHASGGACTLQNATDDLGKTYANGQVYPINTISYYVRKKPGYQPGLYRKKGREDAEELIEGIEKMQILYGVDTDITADGTANYYVTADKVLVPDWRKVVSVRISLLLVSLDDNLTDKPVSYTYNGVQEPGDRHLRKVFTSTIALRNRLS